jgi:hypothetical protein
MSESIVRKIDRAASEGLIRIGHKFVTKTDDYTVLSEDNGTVFGIATDGKTFTLPAAATATKGMMLTFVNTGADDAVKLNISPQSDDAIHGAALTSVDDEDLSNTKSGANEGDFVILICDGSVGWWILGIQGTWAKG